MRVLICLIVATALCGGSFAGEFEAPPAVRASQILPPDLLRGPGYTVDENVGSEGYFRTFTLKTEFGTYPLTTTSMLRQRVNETRILHQVGEVHGGVEFAKSLKDDIVQVPVQSVKLVTEPVQSVKNIGNGIKGKFQNAGRFLSSGRDPSVYEDNAISEATTGALKRKVAIEMGLDPYSSNPKVQKLLNSVARARALGGVPLRVAGMAVPPVGWGLTVLRLRRDISDDLASKSPSELHALNNKALKSLRVQEEWREQFLDNKHYSPRHKTELVANLEAMKNIAGLENFLLIAIPDASEEEAVSTLECSEMFLYFHKEVESFREINLFGNVPIGITKSNRAVILMPLDFGFWNERAAEFCTKLSQLPCCREARSREFLFKGELTPAARENISRLGFNVRDNYNGSN